MGYISEAYIELVTPHNVKELYEQSRELKKVSDDIDSAIKLYKNKESVQFNILKNELYDHLDIVIMIINDLKGSTAPAINAQIRTFVFGPYISSLNTIRTKKVDNSFEYLNEIHKELSIQVRIAIKILGGK